MQVKKTFVINRKKLAQKIIYIYKYLCFYGINPDMLLFCIVFDI